MGIGILKFEGEDGWYSGGADSSLEQRLTKLRKIIQNVSRGKLSC